MDDINVTDHDELEAFLREVEKRDGSREQVIAFAARAALRTVPIAIMGTEKLHQASRVAFLLAHFRASSVSWVAAAHPTHDTDFSALSASLSAGSAVDFAADYDSAPSAGSALSAADSAALSALSAADSADSAALSAALSADSAARSAGSALSALSAVLSAAPSARSALFALSSDLTMIAAGQSIKWEPLWPDDERARAKSEWDKVKPTLQALDDDWDVWTDWYEARLRGGPTHRNLSPAANERIEVARVLEIENGDWDEGATHVNAKIKAIIERETERDIEERAETQLNINAIPEGRLTSIRSVWRNGKAYLDASQVTSDLADMLAGEELQSLREEVQELIETLSSDTNHDPGVCAYLNGTLELLPDGTPTSAQLFRLIRREITLLEMAETVNTEWPDMLAARYRASVCGLTEYLNLFPLRRERRRIDLSGILEEMTGNEARADLQQTTAVLRTETAAQVVDGAIPEAVDAVVEEVPDTDEPLEGAGLDAAVDAYDGINGTAITLARNGNKSPLAVEVLKELEPKTLGEAEAFAEGYTEKREENFGAMGRAQADAETGVQLGNVALRNRHRLFD